MGNNKNYIKTNVSLKSNGVITHSKIGTSEGKNTKETILNIIKQQTDSKNKTNESE